MDVSTNVSAVSTNDLESAITSLCADINVATYRQLIMIAEFDRR